MSKKVLIAEEIAEEGIDSLRSRGYEVDVMLDLTPEQLRSIIAPYSALIVRSATIVDEALLDAASQLKIVGRAGVTLDNIDIQAANDRGIIVCNAPTSNIISAAEHTMALLLSCARFVPQANASMHAGKWDRRAFTGAELYGKTLAIFGLGRVGSLVAERAVAFGMEVIAYDPYCSPERASQLDVTIFDNIDDVIERADFITVHLPRTSDTLGMFGPREFAKMKNGVVLVNAARGGIFDEASLADFVAAGKVASCGIDIFSTEPSTAGPLHELENAILTPHISALTHEAQVRAGEQIAEYVWAGLEGSIVPTAVNSSSLPPEVLDEVRPYAPACKMMGRMAADILSAIPRKLKISLEGKLSDSSPDVLIASVIDGILSYKEIGTISMANALEMAARHGIEIDASSTDDAGEYASVVRIKADDIEIASTMYGKDQTARIVSILGYKIDISPAKQSLIFEYADGPGRIGVIGTILGEEGINITTMQIGTKPEEKNALVYLNIDGCVTEKVIERLKESVADLKSLMYIKL